MVKEMIHFFAVIGAVFSCVFLVFAGSWVGENAGKKLFIQDVKACVSAGATYEACFKQFAGEK